MRNFQDIIKEIAAENKTTPDNVLQEMQRAIDVAHEHHSADAQPLWDIITFSGDSPAPEAFVLLIAMILKAGESIKRQTQLK